jgi:hypothetical protein
MTNKKTFLKVENPYLIKTYSQLQHTDQDWADVEFAMQSYIIHNRGHQNLFLYPGYMFSNQEAADYYQENVYQYLSKYFTPPRGNVSNDLQFVVCGIKPGKCLNELFVKESSWLYGPSSKVLHEFLKTLSIFPYFTNIYKYWNTEETDSIDEVANEITHLYHIIKNIYCLQKGLRILCLGNYTEYLSLANYFRSTNMDIVCQSIWHPSYIARKNTPENFQKWIDQFNSNKLL